MSLKMRFVEWRLPVTPEQVRQKFPEASYVMNVDVHIGRPFKGHVTITCDGMMTKAVTSEFSTMAAFKGDRYTFMIDTTTDPHRTKPISVTIYAKVPVHVREVTLRE